MYTRTWSALHTDSSVGQSGFIEEFGLWTSDQVAAATEIEAGIGSLDLVRLVFCDPHGLARSKTLTATAFRSVLRNGMDFSPGPFLFDTGHAAAIDFLGEPDLGIAEIAGAGDFVLAPDPLTFQVLDADGPGPRTAWVLGDEFLRNGARHPLSTRDLLRRVSEEYAARKLSPVIGLEIEWYLTRRMPGPVGNAGNGFGLQGQAPVVQAFNAGYQFNLDSRYDSVASVLDPLARRLLGLGLPLRSMEHESGPGQVETTFDPMLACDAADAMLFFRTQVKQSCAREGLHASFMSLPRVDGFDPSGWHIHQSVVDSTSGQNIFAGAGDGAVSPACLAYIDGLLGNAANLCLLSVPTVNGYRRLQPGFSLAPTRVGWSFEDRSAMIRVLGSGGSTHLEHRLGEPSANPYLAIGSQLYAGLNGLLDGAGTRPAIEGEAAGRPQARTQRPSEPVKPLPRSLGEALAAFEKEPAEDLLGTPLARCLAKLKRSELDRFESWLAQAGPDEAAVTEWEQREYFENF